MLWEKARTVLAPRLTSTQEMLFPCDIVKISNARSTTLSLHLIAAVGGGGGGGGVYLLVRNVDYQRLYLDFSREICFRLL